MDGEQTSIWKAMAKTPASIVLIIYTFISVWFVGGLSVFHLYLIGTNQSTYENFRYRYDRRVNPFNRGVLNNFLEIFCTSIPPSKNNFRAKVVREPGIPPCEVGSGFVSPNMEKTISDLETGRKPSWHKQSTGANKFEGQHRNDNQLDKDDELSGATLPDGRSILHPRRSSWGRRSGTSEIPPDVVAMASEMGDSNRIAVSNDAFSTEKQQS